MDYTTSQQAVSGASPAQGSCKKAIVWGWNDGLAVKSYYCRGPDFWFLTIQMATKLVNLILGHRMPSS